MYMAIIKKIWETISNNKILAFVAVIVILFLLFYLFRNFFFRAKSDQDTAEAAANGALKQAGKTSSGTNEAQKVADQARALSVAYGTYKDRHFWEGWTEDDEAAYNILSGLTPQEFKAVAEVYRTVFTDNNDLKADTLRYLDDEYLTRLGPVLGGVSTVGFLTSNLNTGNLLDIEKTL